MDVGYWPAGASREETLPAFVQAFAALGYVPCDSDTVEAGFEKIAIYTKEGVPIHASRQQSDGTWTSKLGDLEDIEHTLDGLVGSSYGTVAQLLKRPVRSEA
jgi:hypothetical protein